jgi:hypothetical protein
MDKQKQTNKIINSDFFKGFLLLSVARGSAMPASPKPGLLISHLKRRGEDLLGLDYLILNKIFKGQLVQKFILITHQRWGLCKAPQSKWGAMQSPPLKARRSQRTEVKEQYSFILPLVLSKIEWTDNINTEPVTSDYYLAVGVLSLTALLSFYIAAQLRSDGLFLFYILSTTL